MSLGCGNCRRFNLDGSGYFMLYLLEEEGGKIDYIDEFNRHVSPNSALCKSCAGTAYRSGRADASGLTSGYALVRASSGGDRALWSDISSNRSTARYVSADVATARWPKALEIIEGMPRIGPGAENAEFAARLIAHLRMRAARLHVMAELAPGVIATRDGCEGRRGRLDMYFDRERWTQANPNLRDGTRVPGGLKALGIGFLSEKAFAPPPQRMDDFLRLAQMALTAERGSAWHDSPRRFKFPRDLEA